MKLTEVIKLRGNTNPNTDAFMRDYHDATTTGPDRTRFYGTVNLTVYPFNGKIRLSNIVSVGDKSKGAGTQALNFLKDLADRHDVSIVGTAKAYSQSDEHIQDSSRLRQWYTKHGMTDTGGDDTDGFDMKYNPRRQSTNEAR